MNKKLKNLQKLEKNWDSYGAEPIHEFALAEADTLFKCFKALGVKEPQAVPTNEGGVQLEWHEGGYDLEIVISSEGKVNDVFCNPSHE
jgi:hypothetical protein